MNKFSKIYIGILGFILSLGIFISNANSVLALPPSNFQSAPIITSGLNGPSGFEIAPDGRIFILERTGTVKVFKNGQLLATPFAELPSVATGDRGLIGIAFDPDFNSNHYVYFYYTGLDLINRLVRFDATGDVGTDGPFILYETSFPSEQLHVGGSIRFGADEKIYFAVGDNGYPPNAQDLTNPHGKILRINKDGSVPTDNPFINIPGALPEIWAYGFRNPWRFQFDSSDNRLYGGDVGDFSVEEVNHIVKGGNYGWPLCEGPCNEPGKINPIYSYPHAEFSSAVTGGPIYRSTMFPQEYQGSLFFGDYAQGFIKRLLLNGTGGSNGVVNFDLNAGSVVDIKIAPDGSMYYLTYIPGRLYRVTYSAGNQIPAAFASSDNTKGIAPLTVNFSSGGSFDPDNEPLTFFWEFGDGTTSTAPNPSHTYDNDGTYTVELTVSDGVNQNQSIPITIVVGIPPIINIGAPSDNSTYRAGDRIFYSASAIDGAGFDISDADITTEVVLHHGTHIHPFLGPIISKNGAFYIPTTGEHSVDTWMEIKISAFDRANGLSSSKSVFIYPQVSQFGIGTNIPGLKYFIDGVPAITNQVIEGVVGFFREISTSVMQELNGVLYVFSNWSDFGNLRHYITVPEEINNFIAIFAVGNKFQAQYFNNTNLEGTAVITRDENLINFNWGNGSPDSLISSDNFSARWISVQNFNAGKYQFTSSTDDGVRLYIDGNLVIDKWVDQGTTNYTAILDLNSGNHEIKMEYYEKSGGAVAGLVWDALTSPGPTPTPVPSQSPNPNGYSGEYFDNINLSGAPKLTRIDPLIDFNWDNDSPDAAIPLDQFSARWSKTVNLESGVYEFSTTSDDGVRVYIDDELIIDKWVDQASTIYTAQKTLPVGNHNLKIEYYENFGGAVMKFNYLKIQDLPSSGNYNVKFWNTPGSGEFPQIPQTLPILERDDAQINYEWGGGSPAALVDNDHFIAVWEAQQYFEGGNYKFTTESDDGMRIYIDNQLILDEWNDHSETFIFHKAITSGNHNLKIEYYENTGGAKAKFNFEKVNIIPPFYNVEIFDNNSLTGVPKVTRLDEILYYVWANGSPDVQIPSDNFSIRWTKTDYFAQGTYKFYVFSDDGMRVFVDNNLVFDAWNGYSGQVNDIDLPLSGGNHEVKVEYYENFGGSYAKMYYQKISDIGPTPTPNPIGGYNGKYWNLTAPVEQPEVPITLPTLVKTETEINNLWNDDKPFPEINYDGFLVEWTKSQIFEDGNYEFKTESDDGIRVYVDQEPVIDQWNDHARKTDTNVKFMSAGSHDLKVQYYENRGGAIAVFNFHKTDITPSPTPTPPPTQSTFNGEYFDNMTLSGTPKLVRQDQEVNFKWEMDAPDPLIPENFFSVRWSKSKNYTAGNYSFELRADDGVRFWVDNVLLVDDWTNHAMRIYTPNIYLEAGVHTLKIEYYDNDNNAIAIFEER